MLLQTSQIGILAGNQRKNIEEEKIYPGDRGHLLPSKSISRLVGWGMRSYHTSKEEEIFDRERRKTGTGFVPFVRLNERVEEALLRLVSWYAEETHMLDFSLKIT